MTDIDFKTQLADRLKKRTSGENYVQTTPTNTTPQKQQPPPPNPRNSVISPSFLSPPQSPRQPPPINISSGSNSNNGPASPLLKPPIPDRKNLTQKSSSLGALPTPPKINSFTPPPPPPSAVSMNSLAMPANNAQLPLPPPPPSYLSTPPPPIAPREPVANPPPPSTSPQYKKSPPQIRHHINHPPPPPIPNQPPPHSPNSNNQFVSKPAPSSPHNANLPPTLPPITISSPTMTPPPPISSNAPFMPNRPRQSVHHARSSSLDPKMMAQVQNMSANNNNNSPGHANFANHAPQPQASIQKRMSSELQQKRLSQDALKLNTMLNNRLSGGLSPPIVKPFFDDKVLNNNTKTIELNSKREQEELERKEREQKKKEKKEQEKKEKKEKKEQEKKDKKDKKDKKSSSSSSSTSDSHNNNNNHCTIFSNSLSQVMEIQRERLLEYSNLNIPVILKILTESIISLDGCSTEGIFRVPGTSSEVMRIRQKINELDFSLDTNDVHVLAGLLKLWLRELTDPIIPSALYDDCIKSWNSKNDSLKLLNSIPTPNKDVLFFILNFLKTVSDPIYFSKSKMDIDNIAMVFAPGLLRCPSSDPNSLLLNSQYEKDFIKNLIEIV
ncbi:RhoGAP domain-containing protein [Heterostelium album PN500]|uniref:RhoGAP domain-containing protein n=1 Tax=Heterostelium pallidum (strain ATCC 26659 / Pp 5 / PN500) TaxID=670386 RepID=D3BNE2_HETP5|nr:RhoGAP domain-containing protein [Heterostelium album PN500]EFA76802.1 RhoGAP domain-containing protein [Heterostelium album PN500]|eukprot:XP_020428934.1 RhoGAP domain-containing protein [Heterostelium album PN500]